MPKTKQKVQSSKRRAQQIERALWLERVRGLTIPVVIISAAVVGWVLTSAGVFEPLRAVTVVGGLLLLLALFAGMRDFLDERVPQTRVIALIAFAVVWLAVTFYAFYHTVNLPPAIASRELHTADPPTAVSVEGHKEPLRLVVEGHLPPTQGQVSQSVHYQLGVKHGDTPTEMLSGDFTERWTTRRLGRRGSAPVRIVRSVTQHSVSSPDGSDLQMHLDALVPPESKSVTVHLHPDPFPTTLLVGFGVLLTAGAFVVDVWRVPLVDASDGVMTIATLRCCSRSRPSGASRRRSPASATSRSTARWACSAERSAVRCSGASPSASADRSTSAPGGPRAAKRRDSLMTKIFYESDGDLADLAGARVAVVGYGNQGRSWALNLRDSGLDVQVCVRADATREQARADGFDAADVEAASAADVVCILVPDDVIPALPITRPTRALTVLASGYTYAFDRFAPDRRPRHGRAAHARARGAALLPGGHRLHHRARRAPRRHRHRQARTLAVAKAIGGLRQGAIEMTARQEAILDLAVEQVLSPALTHVNTRLRHHDARAGHPARGDHDRAGACRARSSAPTACCASRASRARWSTTRRPASTASSSRRGAYSHLDVSDAHARARRRHRVGALRRRVGRRARRRTPPSRRAQGAALRRGGPRLRGGPAAAPGSGGAAELKRSQSRRGIIRTTLRSPSPPERLDDRSSSFLGATGREGC